MDEETKPTAPPPAFLDLVRDMEDGALQADLTEEMVDLVHNMRQFALATGGKPKAKITIAFEIKLDGGIFEVIPSYTVKPPKKPRSRSIFYPTKDNGLSTQNAAQLNLPLNGPRAVPSDRPLHVAK